MPRCEHDPEEHTQTPDDQVRDTKEWVAPSESGGGGDYHSFGAFILDGIEV